MATYDNIKDAHKELESKLNNIGRAVAIEVFNSVIIQSPVDTGRFRGNWQCTLNYPAQGVLLSSEKTKKDDKGKPAKGQFAATAHPENQAATMSLKDTLYLTNNLPYAEPLEYGWSDQRGEGWVRMTVAKGQKVLDDKVRELNK